jgi:hypothetical protein
MIQYPMGALDPEYVFTAGVHGNRLTFLSAMRTVRLVYISDEFVLEQPILGRLCAHMLAMTWSKWTLISRERCNDIATKAQTQMLNKTVALLTAVDMGLPMFGSLKHKYDRDGALQWMTQLDQGSCSYNLCGK